MKTISLITSFLCFLCYAQAATITITGPTVVCPGTASTYTTSAANLGLAQKGCFSFTFLVNGVAVGYAGGISCPCARQSSTYSAPFTWPSTGNFEVKVTFTPFNVPLCPYSYGSLTGYVRVVVPERVYDSDGGLSFCSSGQSRTISVPTVVYNASEVCGWHHAYDWIVPSGWTIAAPSGSPYTVITGGIRTHSTSVTVTAPATPLLSGFTGNYFITVRTEPAWPYPKEISRQIWVGPYGGAVTISGQGAVCPGNVYTYTATPPGGQQSPGHTYSWVKPSNWSIQSQASNYITLYVPQSNPSYGPVQFTVNNGCGNSSNGVTAFPGYGCPTYLLKTFPNPVSDEITIELAQVDDNQLTVINEPLEEVRLINSQGETVRVISGCKEGSKIDVRTLPRGQYFLQVKLRDQIVREQIIIK